MSDVEVVMGRCLHFNGLQNATCDAGVNYYGLGGIEPGLMLRLPCLKKYAKSPVECASASFPSEEEAAVMVAESNAAFAAHLQKLADKVCPQCDKQYEGREVPPCVYCEHCGHRLYQGSLA